jgi:hypothetical protein
MHDPGSAAITTTKGSLAQYAVLCAFVAILLWAPFPYGSNRPWALYFLASLTGLLLVTWGGLAVAGLTPVPSSIRRLWPASLLLTLGLVWAAIQMVDLNALDAALGGIGLKGMAHPKPQEQPKHQGRAQGADDATALAQKAHDLPPRQG